MQPAFGLGYQIWWTALNLVLILGIIAGFIILVIAAWRQSKAQQEMVGILKDIAQKLDSGSRD